MTPLAAQTLAAIDAWLAEIADTRAELDASESALRQARAVVARLAGGEAVTPADGTITRIMSDGTIIRIPDIGGGTASGEARAPLSDATNRDFAEDRSAPAADPFYNIRAIGREDARRYRPYNPDALWSKDQKDAYRLGYHEQIEERRGA